MSTWCKNRIKILKVYLNLGKLQRDWNCKSDETLEKKPLRSLAILTNLKVEIPLKEPVFETSESHHHIYGNWDISVC